MQEAAGFFAKKFFSLEAFLPLPLFVADCIASVHMRAGGSQRCCCFFRLAIGEG
jgi:hypothetical protein